MDGYEPFILSFNHALQALKGINVPLRHPTDLQPLFHRNDPKMITATHNGRASVCEPDIILVSLDEARAAFADGDQGGWADHAFKTAVEPPQKEIQWSSPLSVAEFKRTKSTLPLPPDEYALELKAIEPQEFSSDDADLPAEEVTQHSVGVTPNASNPISIFGKPHQQILNSSGCSQIVEPRSSVCPSSFADRHFSQPCFPVPCFHPSETGT